MATRTGRPSKLTPELTEQLVIIFRQGQTSIESACSLVGIGARTFHTWMTAEGEEYLQFQQTIKRARAEAVQHYLDVIHRAAQDHWQAAAWWLERVLPDQYGRKTTVETITRDALVAEIAKLEAELGENDPS